MQSPRQVPAGPAVHPTAVIAPSARLEEGASVGPCAVIGADVMVGSGTTIGPHSVVHEDVTIGRGNAIAAHVVIGGPPQDRAYRGERTRVVIGDNNVFSEFASVDRATGEGLETYIGSGTYIMSGVKISHNCRVEDGAIVVSGSQIGGWAHIGEKAYVGGICGVHQFVRIGRLVMVAGLSAVRQDVPPYLLVGGFQTRAFGLNRVGLQRHGIPQSDRKALRRVFRAFFQMGLPAEEALRLVEQEAQSCEPARHFLEFVREARTRKRGIVRWQAQTEP